ncbi:guanine nucleotide exchange factor subunit RIC1-like isoform X1 [Clavelina lepadiformis]|uniref:guanine nucleotide exchange factor subunit RIC1-like isoform X1 n=1 Tax=Clavelina lepadiformis TaxID=159417 RepID=UPI004042CD06
MYFPVGWPKYLSVGQGKKSRLKQIRCNRYRMLFAVLTETTISIWHCRPCVEIVCYQRCHSSVASIGTNELAEWRQDSSMIAVTTTEGYLLLYQLEQDVKGDRGLSLYEYDLTKGNQGDSNEAIPALRLALKTNVNFKSAITSLSSVHDDLLVTLKDGRLELLSWETPSNGRKSVLLCKILFSVDAHVAGSQIKSKHVYTKRVTDYSPFLDGFAMVLSDGHGALVVVSQTETVTTNQECDSHSSWSLKGIWAPGLNNATCVAVNNKYRLLAFGTEKGDCCVYAVEDVTGCLILSHTIALSLTHYPNIYNSVGSVLHIDWSPDGCALALSWASGGISIWSVFGACLVCTLASDRAYATDGTANIQGIFRSMSWGVEGYQLWLISEALSSATPSSSSEKSESEHSDRNSIDHSTLSQGQENKKKKHFKRFRKKSTSSNDTNTELELGQLLQVQFAKSALATNPCMSNHCHALLYGEDRMFLSIGEKQQKLLSPMRSNEKQTKTKKIISTHASSNSVGAFKTVPHSPSPRRRSLPPTLWEAATLHENRLLSLPEEGTEEPGASNPAESDLKYSSPAVGNKQWTVIQFPVNYLPSNWPIRFASVDESGCYLAIAGNNGLAHYNLISRKWKVFGNVSQEKDTVVTGGLTWWQEFLVVSCYNLPENVDEIRIYPRVSNLDNAFACIRKIRSQILLVNVFQNLLILFTYDCRINIFILSRETKSQRPTATLTFLQDMSLNRYVRYPTLVASVTMSSLHIESATRRSSSSASAGTRPQKETEVIMVNVAGRLLLFQRSIEDEDAGGSMLDDVFSDRKQMAFNPPIVLASCVENMWSTYHKNRSKAHLTDALWLGCGGSGIRVWLPLFPSRPSMNNARNDNSHRGFELQLTARRITLSFSSDSCYPLAVLFNEAVILGVTSETLEYPWTCNSMEKRSPRKCNSWFHFSTMERTSEIYLHEIFRQLLRGNLGYNALLLADSCRNLSCFAHVLELMLHEVLEEEATASEPIPDPLLPTVITFLGNFPEYLQTVAHCARKTEIALWEYLFNSVGSPRELFQECLKKNQLRTAASYLIIVQNLEPLSKARQDATELFDKALQHEKWELANDIARFLRAIGNGDASITPRQPTLLNANIYPALAPVSHTTPTETEPPFKYSSSKLQGGNSTSPEEPTPTNHRRLPSRSYTESYFDLPSPSAPNPAASSQSFLSRFGTRQYHQDHHIHRPLQHSVSNPVSTSDSSSRSKRYSGDKDPMQSKEHAAADCAEHYFIDAILSRQARKMLSERRLQKLGTFAAYVDFQLVPWLKKERRRAARVDEVIICFKALHDDFDWPYPTLTMPKSSRSSYSSAGSTPSHSQSFHDLGTLRSLSPQRSTNLNNSPSSGPRHGALTPSRRVASLVNENGGFGTDDEAGNGILTILSPKDMGSNLTLATVTSEISEVSETSYTFDDSGFGATTEDGILLTGSDVDEKRGHPRSEMKLKYLLELFLEARCLEWSVMICIMLRESSCMSRLVRSASPSQSISDDDDVEFLNTLQRTRDCVQQIDQWAITECPGYKAVLFQLKPLIQSLHDIINAKEVAHAEQQALLASQQLSRSNSASERLGKSTQSTASTSSSLNNVAGSAKPGVVVKRLFGPSTAAGSVDHCGVVMNGDAGSSCSSGESGSEDAKAKMRTAKKAHRQSSRRTRHNSMPSRNTPAPVPRSESIHERTPSSPAKISIQQDKDADYEKANNSIDASCEVESDNGSSLASQSSSNSERRNLTSESSGSDVGSSGEQQDGGCVVS